jgi:hypothetical protein
MKLVLAAAPLLLTAACLPHSAAVGQTAAPVAMGGAEVGMSLGVAQSRMTVYEESGEFEPPSEDRTVQTQLPAVESNFLYGLREDLGLNLHASSAGIQPGLKLTLVRGPDVHLAILPAFGVGVFSMKDPDSTTGESFDSITWMAGGRVLVSSVAGAYGAAGYDFQRTTLDDPDNGEESGHFDFHRLTGAIGYDIGVGDGRLRIRPELAILYGLAGSQVEENPSNPDAGPDDLDSLVLFPSVTFAVQTN